MKRTIGNLALACGATAIAFVIAETIFRVLLFSGALPALRDPGRYFPYSSDGYWKLAHEFDRTTPPRRPHPELGWVGQFSHDSYLHDDASDLRGRRPVLLYGDSFAQCVKPYLSRCFQQVLDEDERFSAGHRMLNYGVGGYGLDQTYLLMKRSLRLYRSPFVVVGLYPDDLDRSLLTVRGGQKPYFTLANGALELRGVPIDSDSARFFRSHPPGVVSYLARWWIYSDLRPTRPRVAAARWLDGEEDERRARAREVGGAILRAMINEVGSLDAVVLVFHGLQDFDDSMNIWREWRNDFVRKTLAGQRALFARDLVAADMRRTGRSAADYFIPGDGHPNELQITLIAGAIRDEVLR